MELLSAVSPVDEAKPAASAVELSLALPVDEEGSLVTSAVELGLMASPVELPSSTPPAVDEGRTDPESSPPPPVELGLDGSTTGAGPSTLKGKVAAPMRANMPSAPPSTTTTLHDAAATPVAEWFSLTARLASPASKLTSEGWTVPAAPQSTRRVTVLLGGGCTAAVRSDCCPARRTALASRPDRTSIGTTTEKDKVGMAECVKRGSPPTKLSVHVMDATVEAGATSCTVALFEPKGTVNPAAGVTVAPGQLIATTTSLPVTSWLESSVSVFCARTLTAALGASPDKVSVGGSTLKLAASTSTPSKRVSPLR